MEQGKEAGRATQGVRLIRVNDSVVSSISVVEKNEEDQEIEEND